MAARSRLPTRDRQLRPGSLAGLAEAAAGRHELVAFAPTRLRDAG